MTFVNKILREVHKHAPLLAPKVHTRLGIWNVKNMYAKGKTAEVEWEMTIYHIKILACKRRQMVRQLKAYTKHDLLHTDRNE